MKLVIASNNKNKIREIKEILGTFFEEIVTLKDLGIDVDVEETGTTFEENALIKAREICRLTGLPALADDSGLCVNALGGAPGVYSARYAGENHVDAENNALLLKNMADVTDRKAHFCTAIVLVYPDGSYRSVSGETYGEILHAPEGSNGFGYDPLFYSYDLKKSFGLATAEEKNAVSHRGRALRELEKEIRRECEYRARGFDKAFFDRIKRGECTTQEVEAFSCDSQKTGFDLDDPFRKYYSLDAVLKTLDDYLAGKKSDVFVRHWACVYLYILGGGFFSCVIRPRTVESILQDMIIDWLDSLSFFDDENEEDTAETIGVYRKIFSSFDRMLQRWQKMQYRFARVPDGDDDVDDDDDDFGSGFEILMIDDEEKRLYCFWTEKENVAVTNNDEVSYEELTEIKERLSATGYEELDLWFDCPEE